jgi:putative ABC transport system substrate-binding protein
VRRRSFIAALGGAAAWPVVARAQQTRRTYRVGLFTPIGRDNPGMLAFFDELRLNGYIEAQNLTVIAEKLDAYSNQLDERAATIAKTTPDVIFSGPDPYTRAIQNATRTVPIVAISGNLVAAGLVGSLARPNGNTTGVSMFAPELDGKRQDLLIEAVPGARRIAALADGTMSQSVPRHFEELQTAARQRSIELLVFSVTKPEEIAPAINEATAAGAQALNFLATPLFFVHRNIIIEQVANARLPAMYQWPEMAEGGGLAAYGSSLAEIFRQVARLVIKVLNGANPSDTPAEQPTKFKLVINLKSAKSLGLAIPPSLLARADEVIE